VRYARVGEEHLVAAHDDILRLDVAMSHLGIVQVLDCTHEEPKKPLMSECLSGSFLHLV